MTWRSTGAPGNLSAQARQARHRLLACAARRGAARVILVGHTRDDVLEARVMRASGGRIGEPAPWSPSPVWPEGRSMFLLRPLIDVRRAELRSFLAAAGERWIEDPANDDIRSARVRARRALTTGAIGSGPNVVTSSRHAGHDLLSSARPGVAGEIHLWRRSLRSAVPAATRAFLGAALLSAAGTDRPPLGARLERLARRLAGSDTFVASLAGARVEADERDIRLMREPGELIRRGPGQVIDCVWDGRFEFEPTGAHQQVRPLSGLQRRLAPAERRLLASAPAAARRALPAVLLTNGKAICPILACHGAPTARPLVMARLAAALGAVQREAMADDVAQAAEAS